MERGFTAMNAALLIDIIESMALPAYNPPR